MTSTLSHAGHRARREAHDRKETLGRVGLVGRGFLYAVVALLALQLALGAPDAEASPNGALAWIGERPFGKFLLVALTAALFALAAWRFLDAAFGDPVEGSETSDRVRFAGKGAVYLALAVAALSTTIANWGGSTGGGSGATDGSSQKKATAVVLSWPMGQWIVAGVGVAFIAYAAFMFKRHALDEKFLERLSNHSDAVSRFGRFGYGARSVVWAVIGYLLVQAAVTYNPDEAGGLSSALYELAGSGWGRWVLALVALGLFAFGAFCVAEARYRKAA